MKQRIYIDTSIVGGYFDVEFKEATIALFERLENKEVIFVVSNLLFSNLLKKMFLVPSIAFHICVYWVAVRQTGLNAVKMMREIRDKISSETQNMTYEDKRLH